MIPQKLLTLLLISFSFLSCENKDPYQGEYIELSFEQKMVIGQPDSLSESTIHYSRDLRLGPDGNIYVADAGVSKIKVFSPTGKLVNSFGRRGRGPGELTGIKGFTVSDSTVVVWDQNIQRITIFGLDGKLRTVHNFKGLPAPMRIYPMENSYLALYSDYYGEQLKKTQLAHIYSADFSKQKANFLFLDDVNENIEKISTILTLLFGSVHVQNSRKFLFVPIIYGGNIYEYSKTSKGWQQTHIYQGLNRQTPFSIIDEDDSERKPDVTGSSIYLPEDVSYIGHNWSMGLLKYNGYIFHFTFSDINDKRVFGVELYDRDMNPVGYAPIESIPITNEEGNALVWTVEDVDKKGNFYFLQRDEKGMIIRVMQINDEDLEQLSE